MDRMHGPDGYPKGKGHLNPILDTREYTVTFTDGSTDMFAVSMIVQLLY